MPSWRLIVGLFLVLGLASTVVAAQPTTASPVGSILELRATTQVTMIDAYIERANGRKDAIRARISFLYPGDRIVVRNRLVEVQYALSGYPAPLTVDVSNSPAIIGQPPNGVPAGCQFVNCDPAPRKKSSGWGPIVARTGMRDPGDRLPVKAAKLLGLKDQLLPDDTERLAVVWDGGWASLYFDNQMVGAGDLGFLAAERPAARSFQMRLDGRDGGSNVWQVTRVSRKPPAPEGFDALVSPTSGDRLARALWLLEPGPNREPWRVFALSEIDHLRSYDFAAELAWQAIVRESLTRP